MAKTFWMALLLLARLIWAFVRGKDSRLAARMLQPSCFAMSKPENHRKSHENSSERAQNASVIMVFPLFVERSRESHSREPLARPSAKPRTPSSEILGPLHKRNSRPLKI